MRRQPFSGRDGNGQRRVKAALMTAAALWLIYTALECGMALAIGSVALAANAIGHFERASVQLLLLLALSVDRRRRTELALMLSTMILFMIPITLWEIWQRITAPAPPSPIWLAIAGAGAFVIDGASAVAAAQSSHGGRWRSMKSLLWPRATTGPLIVLAAWSTDVTGSPWHDLIVGLGIMAANIGAARAIHRAGAVVLGPFQAIRSPAWWMRARPAARDDPRPSPSLKGRT